MDKKADLYEALDKAERASTFAYNELLRTKREVKELESQFHRSLGVGKNIRCAAGVLPNGNVVVNVFIADPALPNQLHIVTPILIDNDGKPREGTK